MGDTLPAFMASLEEAISLYLECVEEEGDPDRRRLLARRSPWSVRSRHWARRQSGQRQRRVHLLDRAPGVTCREFIAIIDTDDLVGP